MTSNRDPRRVILVLAGHSAAAMVASVIIVLAGDMFLAGIWRVLGLGPVPGAGDWYGPLVWWGGLFLGFLVNRVTLQRSACFAWLVGLLWLLLPVILHFIYSNDTNGTVWMAKFRADNFPRSPNDCGSSECLGLVTSTWPFLNSVAYSLGAGLALLYQRKKTVDV
jgi:hypothetical protein